MKKKINILGTNYTIIYGKLGLGNIDGLCEPYTQELKVDLTNMGNTENYDNDQEYYENVLRHEKFHAIFHEAGLVAYEKDEILIEALATLYPKIEVIMNSQKLFN